MANKSPILEYVTISRQPRRAMTSIWIAVAIILFSAVVLNWDDPFQSVGNEKPVRIATVAGFLGIVVAIRDMSKWKDSILPTIGLLMNIVAMLAAWTFQPYI